MTNDIMTTTFLVSQAVTDNLPVSTDGAALRNGLALLYARRGNRDSKKTSSLPVCGHVPVRIFRLHFPDRFSLRQHRTSGSLAGRRRTAASAAFDGYIRNLAQGLQIFRLSD